MGEDPATFAGHDEPAYATIGGVDLPLDEAALLERVDDSSDVGCVVFQAIRQFALR
jgi:hypothetical protein